MKDTDKVTLTISQLKRLVKEAKQNINPSFVYSIYEIEDVTANRWKEGGHVHSNYDEDAFKTNDEALADAVKFLKKYKYPGWFLIEVRDYNTPSLRARNKYVATIIKPGIVKFFKDNDSWDLFNNQDERFEFK